ncbi:hypothetical protein SAMN04488107_3050 [Geodermatophilus saharensis]|uniref:DUF3291 domain-containing protein n=1 Tax=Geodermatophilus saharensis TaxID=1137994 RepID=A0A239FJ23_9ACTN|nr:hypothetical protein [Geodermatophilus saharensis]SNS56909.1 hypothetical protein SAMN04488107_3050 [Geodermatophilus saharensis]
MRSSSWTPVGPAVTPSAVLTLVGVRLRLRAGADAGPVVSWADRLRAELDRTPDLTGYALRFTGGSLWVVSAWSRRTSLAAFERGALHTAAQRELRPLLRPPVVVVWRAAPADPPPSWEEVRRRLCAAGERTRTRLGNR